MTSSTTLCPPSKCCIVLCSLGQVSAACTAQCRRRTDLSSELAECIACAVCLAGFVVEGADTREQLMLSLTLSQPDDVGIAKVRQAVLVLVAACLRFPLLDRTPAVLHSRGGVSPEIDQVNACRRVRWPSWSRQFTKGCARRALRGRFSSRAWTLLPSSVATGGPCLHPSFPAPSRCYHRAHRTTQVLRTHLHMNLSQDQHQHAPSVNAVPAAWQWECPAILCHGTEVVSL